MKFNKNDTVEYLGKLYSVLWANGTTAKIIPVGEKIDRRSVGGFCGTKKQTIEMNTLGVLTKNLKLVTAAGDNIKQKRGFKWRSLFQHGGTGHLFFYHSHWWHFSVS